MSGTTRLPPLLLVGFGRMAGAMAAGWREQGFAPSFAVDPAVPASPGFASPGLASPGFASPGFGSPGDHLRVVPNASDLPEDFAPQAVILAVKPQMAAAALPDYRRFASSSVFLSIMAGCTRAGIAAMLGGSASIVRAMPNTPAAIRQGVTVAFAGPGVTPAQRALCDALLRAIGSVAWLEDEALLDPVTAISGGGPAYVFLLAELLERAALAHGLPADLARLLGRQTVAGSGALLAASDEAADAMRRAVTSPGGTTERALAVLMRDEAWPALMAQAIAAATSRARELANQSAPQIAQ